MARAKPTILDDDEPSPPERTEKPRETSRRGFEWGLASTLMGMTFLIAGTGGLIVCLLLWFGGGPNDGRGIDQHLAQVAAAAMGGGSIVCCIIGFYFGMHGLGQARSAAQPTALPLAGIFVCTAALMLWIIVVVDFFMIIDSFQRWRDF